MNWTLRQHCAYSDVEASVVRERAVEESGSGASADFGASNVEMRAGDQVKVALAVFTEEHRAWRGASTEAR